MSVTLSDEEFELLFSLCNVEYPAPYNIKEWRDLVSRFYHNGPKTQEVEEAYDSIENHFRYLCEKWEKVKAIVDSDTVIYCGPGSPIGDDPVVTRLDIRPDRENYRVLVSINGEEYKEMITGDIALYRTEKNYKIPGIPKWGPSIESRFYAELQGCETDHDCDAVLARYKQAGYTPVSPDDQGKLYLIESFKNKEPVVNVPIKKITII
jgi:hypothetical protein